MSSRSTWGGTTTKASIIEGGRILRARDYEVGGAVSVSSRLVRGGGYLVRIPVIDISEVGAGGGSLASIDPAGALRVGPRSAGAVPGPACYGQGNEQPTVTDANLVLGYLHDGSLAGGALQVDRALAEAAIETHIAQPAGLSHLAAAHGVHLVANSNMVRAIKSVSVERGRDPSDFSLMAFGGAGPIHAAGVAEELNIARILVPPAPGLFSAFGLLHAEVEHHVTRTVLTETASADEAKLQGVIDQLKSELSAMIREEGFDEAAIEFSCFADLRYSGQSSELMVSLGTATLDAAALRVAEAAFEVEYERLYGHLADRKSFDVVNLHVIAKVHRDIVTEGRWEEASSRSDGRAEEREVYFGSEAGAVTTRIIRREELGGESFAGPLIVEEYDSTIVVPPGWRAWRDPQDNIVIDFAKAD